MPIILHHPDDVQSIAEREYVKKQERKVGETSQA
jgi:hypothetical protein